MAAQEIPLVGYQPKLLNRVEVAEGTMKGTNRDRLLFHEASVLQATGKEQ